MSFWQIGWIPRSSLSLAIIKLLSLIIQMMKLQKGSSRKVQFLSMVLIQCTENIIPRFPTIPSQFYYFCFIIMLIQHIQALSNKVLLIIEDFPYSGLFTCLLQSKCHNNGLCAELRLGAKFPDTRKERNHIRKFIEYFVRSIWSMI